MASSTSRQLYLSALLLLAALPLAWAGSLACLNATSAMSGCRFADADSTLTTGCCTDPNRPCTLATALSVAVPSDWVVLAPGAYTGNFKLTTPNVVVTGRESPRLGSPSVVTSAGISVGVDAAFNPVEAIFALAAPQIIIRRMQLVHPPEAPNPPNRDVGVWFMPPANMSRVTSCIITRQRSVERSTGPFSRGIFVLRAENARIRWTIVDGPYEDAIHAPTSYLTVGCTTVSNFKRAGIITIQETNTSVNTGIIINNTRVYCPSGSSPGGTTVGIEIQTDSTNVTTSEIYNCATDIRVCGDSGRVASPPACNYVPPVLAMPARDPSRTATGTWVCDNHEGTDSTPNLFPAGALCTKDPIYGATDAADMVNTGEETKNCQSMSLDAAMAVAETPTSM